MYIYYICHTYCVHDYLSNICTYITCVIHTMYICYVYITYNVKYVSFYQVIDEWTHDGPIMTDKETYCNIC